jgi:RNA polymerase sigma factor (TIGR02999 family)
MHNRPVTAEATALIQAFGKGDKSALDRLIPLIYNELRSLAQHQLRREQGPRTLSATGLVHEAYFKLAGSAPNAGDRAHFLAIAAHVMRQVLVDQARRRRAGKRGGELVQTTLGDNVYAVELRTDELLALDQGLEQLEPRQRQVVELRYFGGLEEKEIAAVLKVTERTVRRDWVKARARLYRSLYIQGDATPELPEE